MREERLKSQNIHFFNITTIIKQPGSSHELLVGPDLGGPLVGGLPPLRPPALLGSLVLGHEAATWRRLVVGAVILDHQLEEGGAHDGLEMIKLCHLVG